MLRIISQHLAHFFLCESHHLVEVIVKRVVGADIEAAGEVIKGYGTDTGDEDTLDARISALLYCIEECAQVASAVSLALIFIKTCGIRKDMIGEVVILVDEEIYFCIRFACFSV